MIPEEVALMAEEIRLRTTFDFEQSVRIATALTKVLEAGGYFIRYERNV